MSEESKAKLPSLPVFNLPQVFRSRDRLMDLVLDAHVGTVAVGDAFRNLVRAVQRELLGSDSPAEELALGASMRYLAGLELTKKALFELAWRLAGNVERLRDGLPVHPWCRQEHVEWVPVQVVATRYAIQKKPHEKHGRAGRTMRFAVLAGSPCPMHLTQWWSNEKLNVVAYAVGFKRRPPMYKADHAEIMSMRFLALIDPARSTREPGFYNVGCPSSFLAYNRALIKKRRRIGFSCPEGFEHQCHQCPLGVRSCEAACHTEDYEEKDCPACGRSWWFDTDRSFVNDNCVRCQPLISAGIPVKREPSPEEKK